MLRESEGTGAIQTSVETGTREARKWSKRILHEEAVGAIGIQ